MTDPDQARGVMNVAGVREAARSAEVVAALEAVDRAAFLPRERRGEPAADASVWLSTSSCASQPSVVVRMLEQARVRPGHHVLEIGTGSGYNAALLGRLVGTTGHVVTMEIDGALAERARQLYEEQGIDNVEVISGDGGDPPVGASFDRIIATCAMGDLPRSWLRALAPDGLLLVPLVLRSNVQVCAAFVRDGAHLVTESMQPALFIAYVSADGERAIRATNIETPDADRLWLTYDGELGHRATALAACFERVRDWSRNDVLCDVGYQAFIGGVAPWLAANEPYCVSLSGPSRSAVVGVPSVVADRVYTLGRVTGASVALLDAGSGGDTVSGLRVATPRNDPAGGGELARLLRAWDRQGRPMLSEATMSYLIGEQRAAGTGVIPKANGTLVLEWPAG